MRLSSFFYTLIFIILVTGNSFANPNTNEIKLFQRIQSALFNDDFSTAHSLSDSLITVKPHHLSGHLFKAATYLAEMTYREDNLYPDQFFARLNSIDNLFEYNTRDADSTYIAWQYLWRGHSRAYLSLWESRFGSVTSALKQGINARKDYEKGLEYDSTCYDLYGGLGMYHYWKSVKGGILTTLGIFNDDEQRGLDELYLTIDSSLISKTTARNALVWIYLDKKEYDSVLIIADELLAQFPEGTMFHWPIAKAALALKDYKFALAVFLAIREELELTSSNYYNLIECDYELLKGYNQLGDSNGRQEVVEHFKSYYQKIGSQTRNRQNSKIAFIKRFF